MEYLKGQVTDPETAQVYLDIMIQSHTGTQSDYTRTEYLPLGVTSEVIKTEALVKCYNDIDPAYSQYLLLYLFNPRNYRCHVIIPEESHRHPSWSLTVDTPQDWERTLRIFENTDHQLPLYEDILNVCNKHSIPNLDFSEEGYIKFPAGVSINYKTFRYEMDMRMGQSQNTSLKAGEYRKHANVS